MLFGMVFKKMRLFLLLGLVALCIPLEPARCGDEDAKKEAQKSQPAEPEPAPLPEEPEAPPPALGEEPEPETPKFGEEAVPAQIKPAKKKQMSKWPYDPDNNIDYSELLGMVDLQEGGRGVLPPALGVRGYRPNLIALSAGERTPGYGGYIEYSWNRLGMGVFGSYRNLSDYDRYAYSQAYWGAYGIFRWLPWAFSPYILAGLEFGSKTPEKFGGLVGSGLEVRVYQGIMILVGWTYHSTAQKGFWGGALGWAF